MPLFLDRANIVIAKWPVVGSSSQSGDPLLRQCAQFPPQEGHFRQQVPPHSQGAPFFRQRHAASAARMTMEIPMAIDGMFMVWLTVRWLGGAAVQ